jgi:hypothetical protein
MEGVHGLHSAKGETHGTAQTQEQQQKARARSPSSSARAGSDDYASQ